MEIERLKRWITFFVVIFIPVAPLVVTGVIVLNASNAITFILSALLFFFVILASFFNILGAWYFLRSYGVNPVAKAPTRLPTVAVVVAAYNEDPGMVCENITKLKGLDYPKEKLKFYLVDDSTDEKTHMALSSFAKQNNVSYVWRNERKGFKGGALNDFLKDCNEEFMALFDADEELSNPAFLKDSLGWFETDEKIAYVQTVKSYKRGSIFANAVDATFLFFFDVIQPTRYVDGFSMFCGSCGVLRVKTLKEMGGFPDSVTEDAAYSFYLDLAGYRGVYLKKTYALGKPIESFTDFERQQWRYNFGNTRLFPDYLQNIHKIPLGKQVHHLAHIFGLHYLSWVLVALAILTLLVTFSDFRTTAYTISAIFWEHTFNITLGIDFVTYLSIFSMLAVILLLSKMYFRTFTYGFLVYILNFGVSFTRTNAAISAFKGERGIFKNVKREGRIGNSLVSAFRSTAYQSLFSIVFLFFGAVSFLRADLSGAFWLSWYGALFSSSFIFSYTRG
ncbi:MAG: glycosyltransferase [Candidatus Micrarchaeota archaeon]